MKCSSPYLCGASLRPHSSLPPSQARICWMSPPWLCCCGSPDRNPRHDASPRFHAATPKSQGRLLFLLLLLLFSSFFFSCIHPTKQSKRSCAQLFGGLCTGAPSMRSLSATHASHAFELLIQRLFLRPFFFITHTLHPNSNHPFQPLCFAKSEARAKGARDDFDAHAFGSSLRVSKSRSNLQ